MSGYRLYHFDGLGRVCSADVIMAGNDTEAIEQAREVNPSGGLREIWQGARLVATLKPQSLAS